MVSAVHSAFQIASSTASPVSSKSGVITPAGRVDTVTGDAADRLYVRLGWTRVGEIPDYALYPDGRPCATTIFWKKL